MPEHIDMLMHQWDNRAISSFPASAPFYVQQSIKSPLTATLVFNDLLTA